MKQASDFISLSLCVLTVSDSRTARDDTSGDYLVEAAAEFARADGAAGLMLETGRDNAPARALYRAAGWNEDHSQWYSLALA